MHIARGGNKADLGPWWCSGICDTAAAAPKISVCLDGYASGYPSVIIVVVMLFVVMVTVALFHIFFLLLDIFFTGFLHFLVLLPGFFRRFVVGPVPRSNPPMAMGCLLYTSPSPRD